ncbi:small ribosomal subunit protein uS9m [Primulina huaijiensis]|uniref:small ribosomal subunit protein uS9m n=1 Tax=Primulina huaijiensis TaxID=1492673 RepID=UPI003CC71D89
MLTRFIFKPSHCNRFRTLISSQTHFTNANLIQQNPIYPNPTHFFFPRASQFSFFSTNGKGGNFGDDSDTSTTDLWKLSSEIDQDIESVFSEESGNLEGFRDRNAGEMKNGDGKIGDVFEGIDSRRGNDEVSDIFGGVDETVVGSTGDEWAKARELEPWNFAAEEKEGGEEDVFYNGVESGESGSTGLGVGIEGLTVGSEKSEEDKLKLLESEEKALVDVLKGPNRAFGDLIAASGITDDMLDSLIALKDFEGIRGLPPLSKIEDMRYEKNTKKSSRAEIERQKQEEIAKARVQQVDAKGRAYGTGRRKCSIARVWICPGEGKFVVNDKEFDVYFPMLDHRAALLRPFSETKTLGMWDVNCTVKGGGTSGQVGAIRLGISRALQNWEPGFRPPLKEAGFLTRDSRVVERKKPGKAKARKSFQWVKR